MKKTEYTVIYTGGGKKDLSKRIKTWEEEVSLDSTDSVSRKGRSGD